MKKYKLYDPELMFVILNKQLEKYNITVQDIMAAEGYNENSKWYDEYTFDSEEEYNNWKEFTVNLLTKQITPKLSKKRAQEEFSWLSLMWGLKKNYK